ncbi:unnamed protein product [Allacma fusca]|uniref:Uncharacterized protein n=1 Tax=Allacma fusca TaxID=39272 RepID=A0A8J2JZV5_9HEXA|nr:unnamed protein product [Allacma fusca]
MTNGNSSLRANNSDLIIEAIFKKLNTVVEIVETFEAVGGDKSTEMIEELLKKIKQLASEILELIEIRSRYVEDLKEPVNPFL